jgi:hypothetical protein
MVVILEHDLVDKCKAGEQVLRRGNAETPRLLPATLDLGREFTPDTLLPPSGSAASSLPAPATTRSASRITGTSSGFPSPS